MPYVSVDIWDYLDPDKIMRQEGYLNRDDIASIQRGIMESFRSVPGVQDIDFTINLTNETAGFVLEITSCSGKKDRISINFSRRVEITKVNEEPWEQEISNHLLQYLKSGGPFWTCPVTRWTYCLN